MSDRLGTPLTAREESVLAEYQWHGNRQEAADCLGMTITTLGDHVTAIHERRGVMDAISAAMYNGWSSVPQRVRFRHRVELAETLATFNLRPMDPPADPLDGLNRRELEALRDAITERLGSCIVDGKPGAKPISVVARIGGNRGASRFTLHLCPECIERHRLPESRAEVGS